LSAIAQFVNGPPKCGTGYQEIDFTTGPVRQSFDWTGGTIYFKVSYRGDQVFLAGPTLKSYGVAYATINAAGSTTPSYTLVNVPLESSAWTTTLGQIDLPAGTYDFVLASGNGRTVEYDDIGLTDMPLSAECDIQDRPTQTPSPTITNTPRSGDPTIETPTPDPSRTATRTPTTTRTPTRTALATKTAAATRTATTTRTAVPGGTSTTAPSSTAIVTATPNAYAPSNTPGGPTITPGGDGVPVQPEPNWTVTPCPPGAVCLPGAYTAKCIRPPDLQYNSAWDTLPNLFQSVQRIPWWIDYETCEVKDWFAFKPQHAATLMAIPTSVANKEPFGTLREAGESAATLQAQFDSLDYGTGLEGVQETAETNMFIPDASSPWNGGKIDWTTGSSYKSTYCKSTFTDTLGSLLAPGACTLFNILRDIHMLPWFQFFINLTCLIIIIVSTIKAFVGQARSLGVK
jgi:hypothetical protein